MPEAARVAVVTGASSGIGEATARSLAGAGFKVVLGARREDRLMAVAGELGGGGLRVDVRVPVSIPALVDAITAEYGQVEILVNNAGLAAGLQPLTGADVADCIVWVVTRPAHVNVDQL